MAAPVWSVTDARVKRYLLVYSCLTYAAGRTKAQHKMPFALDALKGDITSLRHENYALM